MAIKAPYPPSLYPPKGPYEFRAGGLEALVFGFIYVYYIYIYTYLYIYIYRYVCVYIIMCVYMCMYIYIYTYVFMYSGIPTSCCRECRVVGK